MNARERVLRDFAEKICRKPTGQTTALDFQIQARAALAAADAIPDAPAAELDTLRAELDGPARP